METVNQHIVLKARLPFGEGQVGKDSEFTPKEEAEFAEGLAACTYSVKPEFANTADCIEDRETISFENGFDDPVGLRSRAVPQLPGGLVLAATKGAVAANAVVLSGTKSFQEAYEKMYDILTGIGYKDGGHHECGASANVQKTVGNQLPLEVVYSTLKVMTPVDKEDVSIIQKNIETKRERLDSGYFTDWSAAWHEQFLKDRVPQNFAYVAEYKNAPGGHPGRGLYIPQPGLVLAKNEFVETTSEHVFTATPDLAVTIGNQIGGTPEERRRIALGIVGDIIDVGNVLYSHDFSVFADAA